MLAGRRNGFLPLVMVDYYYALPDDWTPPDDGSVERARQLRNDAPLVVEKKFGKGRVVAQLTKLSSGDTPLGRWTNWSLNPVFPVLANELVAYLAAGQQNSSLQLVGDDLVVRVPQEKYDPAMRFILPNDGRPEAQPRGRNCRSTRRAAHGELTASAGERCRRAESTKCNCSRWKVRRSGGRLRSMCRPAKATCM